jgi:hypothetical protein
MELLADYLNNNRDKAKEIHNKLVEQREYLNYNKDGNFCITKAIREITDENILDTLIEKSDRMQKEIEDEKHWTLSATNISKIKRKLSSINMREIDLLNTLCNVSIESYYLNRLSTDFHCMYVLNGCHFHDLFEQHTDENNVKTYTKTFVVQTDDEVDEHVFELDADTIRTCAFQSAMTITEYTTFTNNLSLVIWKCRMYLKNDDYTPHHAPTVNIANLLLCAMNEQDIANATLTGATMSAVELVLYDVFLLKCITTK